MVSVNRPAPVGRLLVPVAAATTAGVLPGFLIGSQAVQLARDLSLGPASVGAAVAVSWLTASAVSTSMGALSERIGGATGLRLAAMASAFAMASVALAARSWVVLAACAALGGAANSLAQPSANVTIARCLPPERHGMAFGVKQSAVQFAAVLGGLAVPTLTLTVGWRATFGVGAALALLAAVMVPGDRIGARPRVTDAAPGPARRPSPVPRRARLTLVVLGGGVACGAAGAGALTSFVVPATVEAGLGEGSAGLLLMGGSALGIAVRLGLGARADRVGGDQLRVVARMMVGGGVALAVFAATEVPLYLLAAPVAFGSGWAWPGLFNLSVVRRHPEHPGAATGMTQTGTFLGAGLGPLTFGILVENFGFTTGWLVAAATMVLGAAAVTAGGRREPSPGGAAPQ